MTIIGEIPNYHIDELKERKTGIGGKIDKMCFQFRQKIMILIFFQNEKEFL